MSTQRDEKDWLTSGDVAREIGAHPQTVRGWIKDGVLPATRVGVRGRYRVRREDLEKIIRPGVETA